jgi:hypothetical protein
LGQDEYFQPFFKAYLELLKANLTVIPVMDQGGRLSHQYLTCGQAHDRRNPDWKPFRLLERHCEASGYDFLEARDMIEERIGRKLTCECDILSQPRI